MWHLRCLFMLFVVSSLFTGSVFGQRNGLQLDDLSYFAVYRLVATASADTASATGAVFSPGISHAGMSVDGSFLAWAAFQRPYTTIHFSDFEGTQVQALPLDPALGTLWEFAVAQDRVVFMPAGDGIWGADRSGAAPLFALNQEVPRLNQLRISADGAWIYFVVLLGPNSNDIYRMPFGQTSPMRFVDNADIPCPAVERCTGVWTVTNLALSADGGTIGAVISGYFVENDDGAIVPVDHDEIVVLSAEGYRYLTDGLPLGRVMNALALSPDGRTAVAVASEALVERMPGPYRWMAFSTGGSQDPVMLPEQPFNHSRAALNADGSTAFLDLSKVVSTRDGYIFDLFPRWNVATVALAAPNNLAISADGTRIAFTVGNEAMYTGVLNDPLALENAPIGIADVSLRHTGDELTLFVATEGPVNRVSLDTVRDGLLVDVDDNPFPCVSAPHDDGQGPDVTVGDGLFTTVCTDTSSGPFDLRIGATTRGQGIVLVVDIPIEQLMGR